MAGPRGLRQGRPLSPPGICPAQQASRLIRFVRHCTCRPLLPGVSFGPATERLYAAHACRIVSALVSARRLDHWASKRPTLQCLMARGKLPSLMARKWPSHAPAGGGEAHAVRPAARPRGQGAWPAGLVAPALLHLCGQPRHRVHAAGGGPRSLQVAHGMVLSLLPTAPAWHGHRLGRSEPTAGAPLPAALASAANLPVCPSLLQHWPFPKDHVMLGYAYILT